MSKKLITIVSVVSLVVLSITGFLVYRNNKVEEAVRPIKEILQAQSTGELSEPGKMARKKLIAPLGEKADALVITEDFEVGYFPPPLERLRIFIFSENPEVAEQDAISWIKSRGFSENDICNFPTVVSGIGSNR